jgi:hypothetical protein
MVDFLAECMPPDRANGTSFGHVPVDARVKWQSVASVPLQTRLMSSLRAIMDAIEPRRRLGMSDLGLL